MIIINTWAASRLASENVWAMINCGAEPTIMAYGSKPWVEEQAKKCGYIVHELPLRKHDANLDKKEDGSNSDR